MYFCNVNSRYPSCPSITHPNTGEHNSKNCPPFHPNLPENKYDSINHPHRIDENETRLHTQLKSPSSEELEALLQGNSTSNFTAYWQHQLLGKVIENYNMSASTYRARGCPCKPRLVDKKEDFERRSRNGEEVKPQIEEERTRKGSQEVSAEEPSPDKVKVCLPLDLEKLVSKDSSGKTIKLIIYGDKAQCDPGVAKTRDKRASNECLACSLAKHPQIRNLYSGWSDERIDKNSKHWKGIPSKISGAISSKLSFFKKKQKSVMRSCCSDKCAQTCGSPRIDALMGASSKVNKACMCFTKNEKERDSGRGSKATSCQCHSCGKIDLEKLCGANPDCFQNDCLKWVLKMEAKQNYRQVKCIMKELQEQRQEIKDLRKRYTSLLQLRYDQSVKEKTVKCKQDFKMPQKETSDEIVCIRSKDLKNAMNQSTLNEQNSFHENNKSISSPPSLHESEPESQAPKEKAINDEKTDVTALEDSCSCTSAAMTLKQRFKNFWIKCCGKKDKYRRECDFKASNSIEKCKQYLVRKLAPKT